MHNDYNRKKISRNAMNFCQAYCLYLFLSLIFDLLFSNLGFSGTLILKTI